MLRNEFIKKYLLCFDWITTNTQNREVRMPRDASSKLDTGVLQDKPWGGVWGSRDVPRRQVFAVTGELLQAHVQFKETGADGGGGGSQLGRLVVAVMLMHDLGYILVQFFS